MAVFAPMGWPLPPPAGTATAVLVVAESTRGVVSVGPPLPMWDLFEELLAELPREPRRRTREPVRQLPREKPRPLPIRPPAPAWAASLRSFRRGR